MKTLISCFLLLIVATPVPLFADFGFDDLDEVMQSEQGDLLAKAKEAARNWNFNQAEDYLKQAQQKAYDPDAVANVTGVIAQNRQAYEAEQERKRREEEERRQAELVAARAEEARQRAASARSTTNGSHPDYVMVNFESVCGLFACTDKNLNVSGGPGGFETSFSGAPSGSIHKGYNGGLAGSYQWSAQVDNNYCSGTFNISGEKANVYIKVYKDCRDAGSYEN